MDTKDSNNSRIFIDGVFDLMHAGHFNALRKAKQFGNELVVGINSDLDCFNLKGCYPIYNQDERGELMKGCKWADEIVIGTPYKVEGSLLDQLNCEFVAHGDDLVLCSDGTDPYNEPRILGRLKIFQRTEGVSTTSVITRIFRALGLKFEDISPLNSSDHSNMFGKKEVCSVSKIDRFFDGDYSPCQSLISASRVLSFAGGIACAKQIYSSNPNITYVDGSFDIFHIGHLRFLERVKKIFGGLLIIGIYDDITTQLIYGNGFPILKMMERALTLLSMRVVDDVIFGVPIKITNKLIETYKINNVVSCKMIENYVSFEHVKKNNFIDSENSSEYMLKLEEFCYEIPKRMGIFCNTSILEKDEICTNNDIFSRIIDKKDSILYIIKKRWAGEINFYKDDVNSKLLTS
ncbi:CTP-ethanolamine cytidylyltransferase [Cryptosporidium ubiquitum]|uniref:ethanolamine-phosphate cytidylyltransferase n=1 Tax=Cryptosporidium ubiquitum TaxID=857276 RepID=A0A1J4MN06_9CRYT|nr:CTP-ethanolamine cytidylyltransferase [Cryptosporidium ubiquitum]OII74835.1 CTP-ethanolamine cytidylyltransferase [Cryptosporidium ubiquitum]